MKKFALGRRHRISLNRDIDFIFQSKHRIQNPILTLCWTERNKSSEFKNSFENTDSRLAIKVSSKVANAVIRNRLKRILREIFRIEKGLLVSGIDILVVVRSIQHFQSIHYRILHKNFMALCLQAGILKQD